MHFTTTHKFITNHSSIMTYSYNTKFSNIFYSLWLTKKQIILLLQNCSIKLHTQFSFHKFINNLFYSNCIYIFVSKIVTVPPCHSYFAKMYIINKNILLGWQNIHFWRLAYKNICASFPLWLSSFVQLAHIFLYGWTVT